MKIQLDNGIVLIVDEYFEFEAKMKGVANKLKTEFPRIASNAMQRAIREHIEEKYPGSKHWDPSKVTSNGDGTVDVDIPGAGRAYHDIQLCLTIPTVVAILAATSARAITAHGAPISGYGLLLQLW